MVRLNVDVNGFLRGVRVSQGLLQRFPRLELALNSINRSNGFNGHVLRTHVCQAQILLCGLPDIDLALRRVQALSAEILQRGVDAMSEESLPLGFLPGMSARRMGHNALLVSIQAEGKRDLETIGNVAREAVPTLVRLTEPAAFPGLVLGIARRRVLRVSCELSQEVLSRQTGRSRFGSNGDSGVYGRVRLRTGDLHLPEQAANTNEVVWSCIRALSKDLDLNGALLERDAREHAGRWGSCEPLVRCIQLDGRVKGRLDIPTSVLSHDPACSKERKPAEENLVTLGALALTASLSTLLMDSKKGAASRAEQQGPPHLERAAKERDDAPGISRRALVPVR